MKPASAPASLSTEESAARPLAAATTLPACAYADPAFLDFERSCIFAPAWQLVGRAEELEETGDHVVAEAGGKPVLVVRGADGVLRGFFNVCKHRAGPLALENGNARHLRCRYHGWTYTLEGRLRTAPEMQEAQGFEISCIHLDPVRVAEWEGLVFGSVKNLSHFRFGGSPIHERIQAEACSVSSSRCCLASGSMFR